jgi:hypothetical protein
VDRDSSISGKCFQMTEANQPFIGSRSPLEVSTAPFDRQKVVIRHNYTSTSLQNVFRAFANDNTVEVTGNQQCR